jgi:dynein heavy chain 2, cytosolic
MNVNDFLAAGEIQWDYIHGLFDQAVYGGRVDNPVDTDVLRSYLMQYFNAAIIGGAKGLKSRLASNINLPNSSELHVKHLERTEGKTLVFECASLGLQEDL